MWCFKSDSHFSEPFKEGRAIMKESLDLGFVNSIFYFGPIILIELNYMRSLYALFVRIST